MSMRTDLKFDYSGEISPISAICLACGERMPTPPPSLRDPAEIVLWLSENYLEHKKLTHAAPSVIECKG